MIAAETLIQKERLIQTFLDLVRIDSPSGEEAELSAMLKDSLQELGGAVFQDKIGNLVASFAGNSEKFADTVMLCAHMDTVGKDRRIQPVRLADRITSDGSTILGADDKSGVAVILEILRVLGDHPEVERPPIEVVFTVQEEVGLVGSRNLDKSRLRSRWGLVLDGGGPIGAITSSGPTSRGYIFVVIGKAAHAAVAPEQGINAIQAAAQGISRCPCGKVDPEVVIGIGVIEGGTATNIVPDRVIVKAMIRSKDPAKLEHFSQKMEAAFKSGCESFGASVEIEKHDAYHAYDLDERSIPWQKSKTAAELLGFSFVSEASLGGTDCNHFNHAGIATCAVSTGMANEHMKNEMILIQDLYDSARHVITAITLA